MTCDDRLRQAVIVLFDGVDEASLEENEVEDHLPRVAGSNGVLKDFI